MKLFRNALLSIIKMKCEQVAWKQTDTAFSALASVFWVVENALREKRDKYKDGKGAYELGAPMGKLLKHGGKKRPFHTDDCKTDFFADLLLAESLIVKQVFASIRHPPTT